ncbi:MFS transporter [Lactobacillus amylovorus DSM 20531]|jgi:MFS family permease|uniref:MFS transporter n=2 Tax=Lactobacillus TaxID=1578 RepID=UPI0007054811|nr:MFS transporter [Lactobacillus amylovorus]ATO52735.1 MFS transporter [Lactobacillus amylovorus DSM 20531]MCT3592873.1 MFS transporter [Lactobacillus amylovorus]MDB6223210.1 MFS transporter [Lactobacillus amylovorus]MDB6240018.1 MFS transporter [Lactobacillus amylovorus]TJY01614.1 MFS transporter [Lactobacillus amylovorus]
MLNKKSYFISRAVGGIANSLFSMVFIWWLQTSTKSSFVVGIAEAIFSTTAALSIFYGPIIDRYSFKKTSYYSMLVQTVFLFATTAAVYQFSKSYILALICAGVVSICDEFFNPADRAILKETVADEQELNNLISKVSSIDQFVNIAGTVFSGLLLTWLISANVMLICSLLSLISLVFLFYALKEVKNRVPQEAKPKYYKQIFSGYKFIKNNQFLNHYFWSSILYSFVTPAMTILLPRIAQRSGKASFYSMFYICFMLGFIIGATIAGKLTVRIKTIGFTWLSSAIPLISMIFFSNSWLIFMGLIFLFGLMTSIHNILAESMIQITSNDEVLGRVLTTIRTSTSIGGPISSIAAGILLDNSDETVLILACGFIILVSGFNIFRAIGKTA